MDQQQLAKELWMLRHYVHVSEQTLCRDVGHWSKCIRLDIERLAAKAGIDLGPNTNLPPGRTTAETVSGLETPEGSGRHRASR